MKAKLLKKIRKRFSWEYRNGLLVVLDHRKKTVNRLTGAGESITRKFVRIVCSEMYLSDEMPYLYNLNLKYKKRDSAVEYRIVLSQFKLIEKNQ